MAGRVRDFPRRPADRPELKHAAVALCVTVREDQAALLITRRSPTLRAHAGQWALPGGRLDPGETVVECALRELEEEVLLTVDPADVLGVLDDYVTRSGYVMTPVVCWAGEVGDLVGAEAEVADVFQIPLADLDVEPRLTRIPESDAPVIALPLLGRYLHAPTAAVIHQFTRIACRNEVVRVDHLEQPVFAWR
jgi:mutator protein MutT